MKAKVVRLHWNNFTGQHCGIEFKNSFSTHPVAPDALNRLRCAGPIFEIYDVQPPPKKTATRETGGVSARTRRVKKPEPVTLSKPVTAPLISWIEDDKPEEGAASNISMEEDDASSNSEDEQRRDTSTEGS